MNKIRQRVIGIIAALFIGVIINFAGPVVNQASAFSKMTKCGAVGGGMMLVNFLWDTFNSADGAFKAIEVVFDTNYTIFSADSGSAVFQVWQIFRNLTNILTILLFLIIVYSQLTGVGLSNYSVKKMLPKLLLAIILVNLSFYLMQFVVDLSNIAGSSIYGFFNTSVPKFTFDNVFGSLAGGATWGGLFTLLCAKDGFGGLMVVVGPIVVGFIVIVATTFVILMVRQAVTILSVAMSPFFFLMMIFPRGEKLFNAWKKALTASLMLFPIMGVLFGVGDLMSRILYPVSGSETNPLIFLSALLVKPLPFILLPQLTQKALESAPMIGNVINKLSSSARSSLTGGLKGTNAYKLKEAELERKRNLRRQGVHTKGDGVLSQISAGANKWINEKTGFGKVRTFEMDKQRKDNLMSMGETISQEDASLIEEIAEHNRQAEVQNRANAGNSGYTPVAMRDYGELSEASRAMFLKGGVDIYDGNTLGAIAKINKLYRGEGDVKDLQALLRSGKDKHGLDIISQTERSNIINSIGTKSYEKGRYDVFGYARHLTDPNAQGNFNAAKLTETMSKLSPDQLAKINNDMLAEGSIGREAVKNMLATNEGEKALNTASSGMSARVMKTIDEIKNGI